jgi:hypothetical protein
VVKLGYFNSLLFPLAAAVRILGKLAGKTSSDDKVPPRLLNAMFEKIFALERHVVGRMPFPAGVSLFALLSTR